MVTDADFTKFLSKNQRISKRISNKANKKSKAGRPRGRKKKVKILL